MEEYHAMLTSDDRLMFYDEKSLQAANASEARSKAEEWAASFREKNPGKDVVLEIRNSQGQKVP